VGISVTIGQYDYTLDSKNRLVVPPSYRKSLDRESGTHFVLAKGFDGCIWLFLPSQWETIVEDLKEASAAIKDKSKARAVRRALFGSAEEVTPDDQGRVLISHLLKDHAKLKKNVVIVGAGNKAEIWDEAKWNAYSKKEAVPALEKHAKDLDL
jgi:MraZ protein